MSLKKDNILIVGAGNMGSAFMLALLDGNINSKKINIIENKPNLKLIFFKTHLFLNLLAPYTSDLNFNIKLLAGASNVPYSTWNTEAYHQNIFDSNRIKIDS